MQGMMESFSVVMLSAVEVDNVTMRIQIDSKEKTASNMIRNGFIILYKILDYPI